MNILQTIKSKYISAIINTQVHKYKVKDSSTILTELSKVTHATLDCFFCISYQAGKTRLEIYGSKSAILTEGTIGQSVGGKKEGIFGLSETGYDAAQSKDVIREFKEI